MRLSHLYDSTFLAKPPEWLTVGLIVIIFYEIFLYGNTANTVASREVGFYHNNYDNINITVKNICFLLRKHNKN